MGVGICRRHKINFLVKGGRVSDPTNSFCCYRLLFEPTTCVYIDSILFYCRLNVEFGMKNTIFENFENTWNNVIIIKNDIFLLC